MPIRQEIVETNQIVVLIYVNWCTYRKVGDTPTLNYKS